MWQHGSAESEAAQRQQSAGMADKTPRDSAARFATRIDPSKEDLSEEQKHFIRQVELQQWKKRTQTLRTRNVVTGLAVGALVLGLCILHSAR